MNKIAKYCLERRYSYFDTVVLMAVAGLSQHTPWWVLLVIPGVILSVVLDNWYLVYCDKEKENVSVQPK